MNRQMMLKMYGPAYARRANTLGAWYDPVLSIGKGALDIFVGSKQTDVYKTVAEQATAERQQLINNVIKWGAILGIGLVAAKALAKG